MRAETADSGAERPFLIPISTEIALVCMVGSGERCRRRRRRAFLALFFRVELFFSESFVSRDFGAVSRSGTVKSAVD